MRRHQPSRMRFFGAASLSALSFFVILMVSLSTALAQENGSGSQSSASSSSNSEQAQSSDQPHRSNSAELNRESREAAGEGENAQFKHSASVRWVSKKTGLSVDQVYWLSVLINFGVIAGVILWASKKNLPGVFRNRTNQIQKAMEEARKTSEDANRRLADIETRLSSLGAEIGNLTAAAEKEAAAEEVRMQAAAEEDARKIVQSVEQEIAALAKAARRELTAYAATLAVSLAAKQIRVDSATDQALVRDFSAQLSDHGGSHDSGSRKGGN